MPRICHFSDGEAIIREALPKSDYDIINRWREINQGSTSQECRLEKIKRDGSYRIKIGGIYYSCEPRKITSGSEIVFHDANSHNGNYFNLANGTPIYFIPRMEDDGPVKTDGILVIARERNRQAMENAAKKDGYPWPSLLELNDENQVWRKNRKRQER